MCLGGTVDYGGAARDLPRGVLPVRFRPLHPILLGAVVASLIVFASACGQQLQPTSYDATYEKNFAFGCSEQSKDEGGPQASQDYCRCVYKGLVEKVPFDDAKAFEEQQAKEDAGDIAVPKPIQKVIDSCTKDG